MARTRTNLARLGRIPTNPGRYNIQVTNDDVTWEIDTGTPNPNPVDGTNVVANPGLDPNNEKLDSITIANSSGVNVDYNVDPRGPLERFRTKINQADTLRTFEAFNGVLPSRIRFNIDGVTDAIIGTFAPFDDNPNLPETITYRGPLIDELYSTPTNPVTDHAVVKTFAFGGDGFPQTITWMDTVGPAIMFGLSIIPGDGFIRFDFDNSLNSLITVNSNGTVDLDDTRFTITNGIVDFN